MILLKMEMMTMVLLTSKKIDLFGRMDQTKAITITVHIMCLNQLHREVLSILSIQTNNSHLCSMHVFQVFGLLKCLTLVDCSMQTHSTAPLYDEKNQIACHPEFHCMPSFQRSTQHPNLVFGVR